MRQSRTIMPVLSAKERQTNFDEVACGFTLEQSKIEASRCLDCKNPRCVVACPVHINIPKFIKEIEANELEKAYFTLYSDNILPAICGRVCPQEKQCEGACILTIKSESVSIGALERYLGDFGLEHDLKVAEPIIDNNIKVAVVGSGPAGLSNAASMRRLGYNVTIFEALHDYGGVLKYGIPDFRLPEDIVDKEIFRLKELGIKFEKNVLIGKSITIDQLKTDYNFKAIFIGSGAGLPSPLNVPGENYSGVYYANEFLTRVNLMKSRDFPYNPTPIKIGNNVAVVGGGNVAMDAARTAKRLGAKNVFILYRRDMDSLPARLDEIHHAIEEDIDFRLLLNPVKFIADNYQLKKVDCEIMELGEMDSSGRRRPMPTGRITSFDIDSCIISIGQRPNPIIKKATIDLETDQWGRIIVDDYQTSIPGVFAGGDVVSGAATVILAMGAGKDASIYMDKYIKAQNLL
jgi:glutamate synthase (NADPH/NADH) small chain